MEAIGFPLASGEIALISLCDAHLVRIRWTLRRPAPGGLPYVRRCDRRHGLAHIAGGHTFLHRVVMGAVRGEIVDHMNGDTLDNRRENLRLVSAAVNSRNIVGSRRGSASGVLGVHWHAQRQKWQASIRIDGRLLHLGLFSTVAEAAARRAEAEVELWGVQPRRAHELNEHRV